MGRRHCHGVSAAGLHKGPWTEEEDAILTSFVNKHGEGNWRSLPKLAGLKRCRKSCRLRWMNYLRPNVKRGNFTPDEDELIIKLHSLLGNRWALIAGRIPGRTDNDIKNYWNSRLKRKLQYASEANLFTQRIVLTTPSALYPCLDSLAQVKAEPYANSSPDSSKSKIQKAGTSIIEDFQAHTWVNNSSVEISTFKSPEDATFSEFSGLECDHHSVEEYLDPWSRRLRKDADGRSGLVHKEQQEPYSPESILSERAQAVGDQLHYDYLTSFGTLESDFVDTRVTSFQNVVYCM
ncbi:hypothetical protein KC19_9G158400 [Ceratodon purpureus]|uniref:Uncharacterized protein n=2 Tax=Ceratodon purpureus TaxID=3225 RepID=A0A8T0H0B7_CERPU|nr:hypothetical protein KC19_9G158400 [Ceratodon purpureus]